LLNDVLQQIEREKNQPGNRMSLEEFEAELAQAEANGELPD
jgi:hypothetical protein